MKAVFAVAGCAAALLLPAGYLLAGPAGIVVAGTVLALFAGITGWAVLAGRGGQAAAVQENHPAARSQPADLPSYRTIAYDVSSAGMSLRHYDHGLRRRLARLLDARLAEQHGLTAAGDPAQARRLAGEDVWPLIDPARPPSDDHDAAGVSLGQVERLISRLEDK